MRLYDIGMDMQRCFGGTTTTGVIFLCSTGRMHGWAVHKIPLCFFFSFVSCRTALLFGFSTRQHLMTARGRRQEAGGSFSLGRDI
jgi:hypothetical protein